jgi:hypothetical protein
MKTRFYLFLTALIQVMLVSMNVIFITYHHVLAMTLTGFSISLIWTFNVKKVAFGSTVDRIIYASGAAAGTLLGYFISRNFIEIYLN